MALRNVLLTTDFSAGARKAYEAAASIVREHQGTLILTHVEDTVPPRLLGAVPRSYFEEIERTLEDEAALSVFDGIQVVPRLLESRSPFEALKDLVNFESVDVIVTATRGKTDLEHFLLGSFAERIVRRSNVPVLVYRESPTRGDKPAAFHPQSVLVPLDFTEESRAVLPWIREMAATYGAHFRVLTVEESLPRHTTFYEQLAALFSRASEQVDEDFGSLQTEELAGIDLSFAKAAGIPYSEIVREAEEAQVDLILLTTHGVLGSVAQNVIRTAPCSVFSVPVRR